MSANKYEPHLVVLPEDDANAALINGFLLFEGLNSRQVQVLPVAGGWQNALQLFLDEHIPKLRQYNHRRFLLVIDFDSDLSRRDLVLQQIPNEVRDRAFVLGVFSEPEQLKSALNRRFEDIGRTLSQECFENRHELWAHQLLVHNQTELTRLNQSVKDFLFP
ncbi:MAG: hypothetical protein ACK4XY_04750 [Chloroherpetonaceae bacterium]